MSELDTSIKRASKTANSMEIEDGIRGHERDACERDYCAVGSVWAFAHR